MKLTRLILINLINVNKESNLISIISKNNTKNNEQFKYLKTRHTWHLVDPSPWPLVASLGAFFMTSGMVLYMHNYAGGGRLCLTGFVTVLYVMYIWWRDIIREATFEEQHSFSVQRGLRLGMILFIVSEIMFFFAFFWAFFHSSLSPAFNIGGVWPPVAIETIQTSGIPLTNTFFFVKFWGNCYMGSPCNYCKSKKTSYSRVDFNYYFSSYFYFFSRT